MNTAKTVGAANTDAALELCGIVQAYPGTPPVYALAGVDLHAVFITLEEFNDGQSLCLEGVKSQLDAFDVVVTPAGVFCATEDAFFESRVRALEVQHFRQFDVAAEDLVPRFQIVR